MVLIGEEEKNNNEKNSTIEKAKKKIIRKLVFILLPFIIILVLISVFAWFIFMDEGTWEDDEKGKPSTYTKKAQLSGIDGITVNKDELIHQALLDSDFTEEEIASLTDEDIIRILRMNEKLGREVTKVTDCTHAEILWCTNEVYSKYLEKPEDLQKLLDAELITQYPKIDNLSPDKLNGIIEFERYETDPDTKQESKVILKYIDREKFTEKFNAYQQNGNREVLQYFTLDEAGNVIVATWMREEGEYYCNNTDMQTDRKKIREGINPEKVKSEVDSRYNITKYDSESITAEFVQYTIIERTIYYKQMVQKYTLSFEYLWSLLVMGESDEFVLGLADLAYNSQIKIGIFDNINKTVNTDIEKYTEDFKERTEKYVRQDGDKDYKIESEDRAYGEVGHIDINSESPDEEWYIQIYEYEHRNIRTTYVNTQQVQVVYANVWIVEVQLPFKNTVNESNNSNTNIIENEEWNDEDCSSNTYQEKRKHSDWVDPITNEEHEGSEYYVWVRDEFYKYKRTINQSNQSKTDLTISKYQTSPAVVSEKTDIAEDTGMNFVKLLRNDHNAYVLLTEPINIEWLCDILLENNDTVNMVDLTKYLLYKARYPDKTRLTFNFEATFQPSMMNVGTNDYIVNIDNSPQEIVIKDVDALKQAFSAYSGSSEIIKYADTFLKLQEKYRVNAVFAAAVSIKETSAGRNGHATDGKNNWFNIECHCGNSSHGRFETYSSPEESIEAFFKLISRGSYYFTQGKDTVLTIGIVYCENAESVWIPDVLAYMTKMFGNAGIDTSSYSGEGVQYYQNDYADISYGDGTIATSGCGPTSFAMVATQISGKTITPADAVEWCGNTYHVKGVGTSWSYFQAAADHFALGVTVKQTSNISEVVAALQNGQLVISSQGPGLFTSGGHYILLYKIDSDGKIYVKDPNKSNAINKGYNTRGFTQSEIQSSAKQYFIF